MTATVARPVDDLAEPATSFDAYAVTSRSGPHVTMQAGVVHAGRFWTTTSSSSLKRRSVERHGVAAAVVSDGQRSEILAGRTTAVRVQRPFALTADPTAPVRAPLAVLRLGITQAEQLFGYLESSGRIPADWLPHRRVLLVTKLDRTLTLDGFELVDTSGDWQDDRPGAVESLVTCGPDDAVPDGDIPHRQVPSSHRPTVRLDARVHLGVQTPTGPIAVPARWLGENRFVTSAAALAVTGADLPGPAVAVFDESTSRRPDEKLGVMFRGRARLESVDGARATVVLSTDRITTWDGFEADTVDVR